MVVGGDELARVENRWSGFVGQVCPDAVDSDVRIGWQAYGKREFYSATLQAAAPSFLRFAVVDPLGRPVLLLVSNGETFTLADNRNAEAYTGRLDSDFMHKYLPGVISGRDLFALLSGRIEPGAMEVVSARRAEQGELFWYETVSSDGSRHMIGLGPQHLRRHLFLDRSGGIVLDVEYSGYTATPDQCGWPGTIGVEGDDLAASLTLEYTKIYGFRPQNPQLFELRIPSHFSTRQVE